jgi:dinuclear metal center YbgI/SA1388 family protein
MNGKEFLNLLNELYPEVDQLDWDNSGFQVGNPNQEVKGLLLCLDINVAVIEEAKKLGANWIISHHPLLFRPLKSISTLTPEGEIIQTLLKHSINLYSLHTNFDVNPKGTNVYLAKTLGLTNITSLQPDSNGKSLGVIGKLPNPLSIEDTIGYLKNKLEVSSIRQIGIKKDPLRSLAIVGGSGSSAIQAAKASGVDGLVTGDVTYHYALDVVNQNFLVFDVGHEIERQSLYGLKLELESAGILIPMNISTLYKSPYIIK